MGQFNSPMMLSKKLDPKKVEYPCIATPKMDGVPVLMSKDGFVSRDGKPITSLVAVQVFLKSYFEKNPTHVLVGEVYSHGVPFKKISGAVRSQEKQCEYWPVLFDMFDTKDMLKPFLMRYSLLSNAFLTRVAHLWCDNEKSLEAAHKYFSAQGYEGTMVRNRYSFYDKEKRSWGCMKLKDEPTMDLEVVGFTEAISIKGEPKGMVGALQCKYKDTVVSIGAGALLHDERATIWLNQDEYIGKIAEIKYMPDNTYDKLRQPVFVRWRDDKKEESYE